MVPALRRLWSVLPCGVRGLLGVFPGFLMVAIASLLLDLAVIAIVRKTGTSLAEAAFIGYMSGNLLSYSLLCRFVYRQNIMSPILYLRYLAGSLMGLMVRVGTVALLVAAGLQNHDIQVVAAAVGLSFVTNYLVTTLWAMRYKKRHHAAVADKAKAIEPIEKAA